MTRVSRISQISLATRVTTIVGVTFIACVLGLGMLMQQSIARHFAEQDAEEYRVMMAAVQRAIQQGSPDLFGNDFQRRMEGAVSRHHDFFFGVFSTAGDALYATPGPDLHRIVTILTPQATITPDNLQYWSAANRYYRGAVVEIEAHGSTLRIVAASDLAFHLGFMDEFQARLWELLALSCAVILLAAWAAVHFGHRPLHQTSERIRNLTAEQLGERLDPMQVPKDLVELVDSFNTMIERIDDAFNRLSHFSTDIAHELRTPITNLTTQIQVALGRVREAGEYREILYSSLEELERMAKIVNEMLWLARTDNGLLNPSIEQLEPAAEIQGLIEYMEAWAAEHDITLTLEGQCPPIQGDRSMFRRAFSNLLTNAIHHADPRQPIVIKLRGDADKINISVENSGEDIPKQDLEKIFDRFYRVDPSRQRSNSTTGAGLGLPIVHSIITAHGGDISVSSSNGKTSFSITLPASNHVVSRSISSA